jgi:hypothetical protein
MTYVTRDVRHRRLKPARRTSGYLRRSCVGVDPTTSAQCQGRLKTDPVAPVEN